MTFRHTRSGDRTAAITVEGAIVIPVFLLLLLVIVVGGTGIFQYEQVACQSREAARWASVRGGDYQRETSLASPTANDILQQVVLPLAANMDPSHLTLTVEWVNGATGAATSWDSSSKAVKSTTVSGDYVTNKVRVTVQCLWTPAVMFGPLTFKSVCEFPMSF
ncbi:TadE/TadG family type IV pilus assembly protein [Zavarzinella formosa]|uniref:TadE/TadG family type IV pilus assembly protein n=1 Tax=Zavarzinella formosa TaxID=360055 RepID=UPI0002E9756B|nr:TadE/TadG family type IV pilus assembly protein [Zavarzinella formosa]